MRKKSILTSLLLSSALFLPGGIAGANALPAGAGYSGQDSYAFDYDDRILEIDIDYGVYRTAEVSWIEEPTGEYLYAYQIANHYSSNVGISLFSISISIPEGADVLDIGSTGSGVGPAFEYFTRTSAEFFFAPVNGHSTLGRDESSNILYFTSNNDLIKDGFGVIHGGAVFGTMSDLPTPLPKLATIAFLGCGFLSVFARRKT